MMNEEELDLALADYLPDNVSTTYSFQRWAHSPGRERARRLLIRFRFSTDFQTIVPHILAFPQAGLALGKTIYSQTGHTFIHFIRLRCCAAPC